MENKHGSLMIGEGVKIDGNIDLSLDVHVFGTVNGEIKAQDVFIGDSGIVNGIIIADNIEVRGQVQQTIEARQTLIIKSTGRVMGNIVYQSLEIENGGTIDGKIDKYNAKKDKEILATPKTTEEKI